MNFWHLYRQHIPSWGNATIKSTYCKQPLLTTTGSDPLWYKWLSQMGLVLHDCVNLQALRVYLCFWELAISMQICRQMQFDSGQSQVQKLASMDACIHESASNFSQDAVHQLPWVFCILPLAQSQVGIIHCIFLHQNTTWFALHHSLFNLHSLASIVATGCYY